jgi:PAS domain S-box-containing protein
MQSVVQTNVATLREEITRREHLLDYVQFRLEGGTWEWDLASGRVRISRRLGRILGLESDCRELSAELILERAHPEDRERLAGAFSQARQDAPEPFEVRIARGDGELRHLRVAAKRQKDDKRKGARMVGVARDVTDERLAASRIRLRLAVSEVLSSWTTLDQSGRVLLGVIASGLSSPIATFWVPEGGVMVPRQTWATPELAESEFARVTQNLRPPKGIELPGWAWSLRRPVDRASLTADRSYLRQDVADRAGLKTAVAFPALAGEQVVAVIDVHSQDQIGVTEKCMQSLLGLGHEIGSALATRLGEPDSGPLTRRELEVLQLAADGLTTTAIASELIVEPATIKTHLDHIYAKLGVGNRTAAVAYALRRGVID